MTCLFIYRWHLEIFFKLIAKILIFEIMQIIQIMQNLTQVLRHTVWNVLI